LKSGDPGMTTHDLAFINTRIGGNLTLASGLGQCIIYLKGSRIDGDCADATTTFYGQKVINTELGGHFNFANAVYFENVDFEGSTLTMTAFSSSGKLINCNFNAALALTMNAGQTVRMDNVTWNTWKNNVTYATNTPTVSLLDSNEYSSTITWDGAGPYTYTVTAATHKLGASKNLDVKVYESDSSVIVDVSVDSAGTVVITSIVDFANASILISR